MLYVRGKTCLFESWALFRILYGSFQALQKALGLFLIYQKSQAKDYLNHPTCFKPAIIIIIIIISSAQNTASSYPLGLCAQKDRTIPQTTSKPITQHPKPTNSGKVSPIGLHEGGTGNLFTLKSWTHILAMWLTLMLCITLNIALNNIQHATHRFQYLIPTSDKTANIG